MRYAFLLLISFATIISCSENKNEVQSQQADVSVTHRNASGEVVKAVASMTIDGMTCSAGCGGKIQQELRALDGVANTTLDFVEERTSNVVTVEYDPSRLSEQEMIKCVHGIGDGQYHVKSVDVVHYSPGTSSNSGGGGSQEIGSGNFGRLFEVLNLLQSVARLIQG